MTPAEGPAAIVGAMLIGFAFCAVVVIAFVALVQARDYLDDRRDASIDAAAKAAERTETWADEWAGRAADVADVEMRLARRDFHTILTTVRAKHPTRLTDHVRKYDGRRSA